VEEDEKKSILAGVIKKGKKEDVITKYGSSYPPCSLV